MIFFKNKSSFEQMGRLDLIGPLLAHPALVWLRVLMACETAGSCDAFTYEAIPSPLIISK